MGKSKTTILTVLVALLLFNVNWNPVLSLETSDCSAPVVTAIHKICTSSNALSGSNPQYCGSSEFHILIDDECVDNLPVTVYMTNIDANPQYNTVYDLPAGTRPIHIRYEYSPGNWVVTDELKDVVFKGMANNIAMFGIDIEIPLEIITDIGCPPGVYKLSTESLNLEVVTPTLVAGGTQNFTLYPILDESNSSTGIFSCQMFMETSCACSGIVNCDPTSPAHQPVYDYDICMECDCEEDKGNGSGSAGVMSGFDAFNSNKGIDISPNPFGDFVQVRTVAQEGNTSLRVRMFDAMGKLVYNQNYANELGPNTFDINTSNLPEGVYYFILDDGIRRKTEKLLLMR
ncbi:MAG: T9SS type A sorting domain-containing protein [Bacteroidota bacterium]